MVIYTLHIRKNNPQYDKYIERDEIYSAKNYDEEGYVHGSNLKFARMVSLNEVFTVIGIKSSSKNHKSTKNSQCVDDYIERIVDITNYLKNNQDLLKIYNELTPGYQKDWARYVYSAKRKETQAKRLLDMETVLGEGYKTMDLYKRKNR